MHTPENPLSPVWSDPTLEAQFKAWLHQLAPSHSLIPESVRLASADASFRRYFRVDVSPGPAEPNTRQSLIIMDSPPHLEDAKPFVRVAELFAQAKVLCPQVLAWNQETGFLLLSDLGEQTLMQSFSLPTLQSTSPLENTLSEPNAQTHELFGLALDALIAWQLSSKEGVLPEYDEALLRRELSLFDQWYLNQHKAAQPEPNEAHWHEILAPHFALIIQHNLSTPKVFVHRDFMTRNLMMPQNPLHPQVGVLDFQDSVYGPITYDIASLMRDAFISWPEEFILDISIRYWERARKTGLLDGEGLWGDFGAFYREIEWMALQRHLKVAGIFARLGHRDQKPKYLADTPRFINYIRQTCARYRELTALLRLIDRVEGIASVNAWSYGRV
jgi:N-acetylmuramate 1-kinase